MNFQEAKVQAAYLSRVDRCRMYIVEKDDEFEVTSKSQKAVAVYYGGSEVALSTKEELNLTESDQNKLDIKMAKKAKKGAVAPKAKKEPKVSTPKAKKEPKVSTPKAKTGDGKRVVIVFDPAVYTKAVAKAGDLSFNAYVRSLVEKDVE
jgi:hypothetical protein